MNELPPSPEEQSTELSPDGKKILLEAAQFYLMDFNAPAGTIDEIDYDRDSENDFKQAVKALWQQRVGSPYTTQFESDFAAIRQLLTSEEVAEAIIAEQRVAREGVQQAPPIQTTPETPLAPSTSTTEAVTEVATSGFGKFLRRRNRK